MSLTKDWDIEDSEGSILLRVLAYKLTFPATSSLASTADRSYEKDDNGDLGTLVFSHCQ